jgi:hypothetical protein
MSAGFVKVEILVYFKDKASDEVIQVPDSEQCFSRTFVEDPADVESVPGGKILFFAPSLRIAVTAAWQVCAHLQMSRSCCTVTSSAETRAQLIV